MWRRNVCYISTDVSFKSAASIIKGSKYSDTGCSRFLWNVVKHHQGKQTSRYLTLQFLWNVAEHISDDTVSHPTAQQTLLHYTDFLMLIIGLLVGPQDEEMDDVHLGYWHTQQAYSFRQNLHKPLRRLQTPVHDIQYIINAYTNLHDIHNIKVDDQGSM